MGFKHFPLVRKIRNLLRREHIFPERAHFDEARSAQNRTGSIRRHRLPRKVTADQIERFHVQFLKRKESLKTDCPLLSRKRIRRERLAFLPIDRDFQNNRAESARGKPGALPFEFIKRLCPQIRIRLSQNEFRELLPLRCLLFRNGCSGFRLFRARRNRFPAQKLNHSQRCHQNKRNQPRMQKHPQRRSERAVSLFRLPIKATLQRVILRKFQPRFKRGMRMSQTVQLRPALLFALPAEQANHRSGKNQQQRNNPDFRNKTGKRKKQKRKKHKHIYSIEVPGTPCKIQKLFRRFFHPRTVLFAKRNSRRKNISAAARSARQTEPADEAAFSCSSRERNSVSRRAFTAGSRSFSANPAVSTDAGLLSTAGTLTL